MTPELETQLRLSVNFPSPPGVASHIIELAQDPEIEMGKVAKAVSLDPALTTKILRIANSPLYAQRRKSENLRQALVVLGLNATLTLALSFSLVKSLRGGKPNGLDYPLYWRRSLMAGTAARALADALRQNHAEEFFLAGLLQDVGMLALDRALPDLYPGTQRLQHDHRAIAAHELARLGVDHAEVGAHAMRLWNLPANLCRAIANSHKIELEAGSNPAQIMDRCVALSVGIGDLFLAKPDERRFAEVALAAERAVGLDKAAFGQILATIGAIIPETEAIFDAQLLSRRDAEMILEQAREVLLIRSLQALRDINSLKLVAERSYTRALDLEEENRRDALTGVYNRAHLDQYLTREFENSVRQRWPLSIAFADLDNFKAINDNFGHQAGDRILQSTARLLRENTRETDLIARYGGEEFLVVLPATDERTARSICDRIVTALDRSTHEVGGTRARITISIGCATHSPESPFANTCDLIKAADQALYTAKMRGRNRAVPFDRELPKSLARFV
jgi:diguanylate cyclase (GGDEF)-like protein